VAAEQKSLRNPAICYCSATGLPRPDGQKMPNCTSKNAKKLNKCQTSWNKPMAVSFKL